MLVIASAELLIKRKRRVDTTSFHLHKRPRPDDVQTLPLGTTD